jgi:hypothetical protein
VEVPQLTERVGDKQFQDENDKQFQDENDKQFQDESDKQISVEIDHSKVDYHPTNF